MLKHTFWTPGNFMGLHELSIINVDSTVTNTHMQFLITYIMYSEIYCLNNSPPQPQTVIICEVIDISVLHHQLYLLRTWAWSVPLKINLKYWSIKVMTLLLSVTARKNVYQHHHGSYQTAILNVRYLWNLRETGPSNPRNTIGCQLFSPWWPI